MIAPLYELIYILPLCQIAVLLVGPYFGVPEKSILGCIVSVLTAVLIHLIRYLKLKGRFITLGVASTLFIGVYLAIGKESFSAVFEKFGWLGICLLLTMGAYLLGFLVSIRKEFRRIIALCLLGGNIYLLIARKPAAKFAVVMCFLVILLCLAEETQERWKKSGYTEVKDHMVAIFPILFALCLAVLAIKAPEKPYDWSFVRETWGKMKLGINFVADWISDPEEAYGDIGFSEGSAFLSQLDGSGEEAFRLKIYSNNPKVFYLSGKTFDTFDGNNWMIETEGGENIRLMDTIETRCAVDIWDEQNEDEYIIRTSNEIESLMRKTQFIFLPSKAIIYPSVFSNMTYVADAAMVNAQEDIREGDTYSISYYALNRTNPGFVDMINSADEISRADWKDAVTKIIPREASYYSYENYQEYREWVYSVYCKNDVASEEVKALLAEITADADTPYEKMLAIEAYLKSFGYSATPGNLPDSVTDSESYLDYFLFESQEGYCVHFATAFVLLARECGMPARYVQGYYVTNTNEEYVTVKESAAHAWPEVYFDNVGWISFEPTPGYSNGSGWDGRAGYHVTSSNSGKNPAKTAEDAATEETLEEETSEEKLTRILSGLRIVLIPTGAVALFLLMYILVSRALLKRRYLHLSNENKIKNLAKRNFRILKMLGYEISKYETYSEYKDRVSSNATNEIISGLSFIDAFEEITYANRKIDSDTVKRFEDAHSILKRELCNTKRFYRMLYL